MQRVIGALVGGLVLWALVDKRPKVGAQIQSLFESFHDAIKLDENDERRKLRAKREILLETLKNGLAAESLTFESILQGSYAMRTGVVPKDGNYDIDVGLVFNCSPKRFPDPVKLKGLVRDTLAQGNRTVSVRRSCVTVTYLRKGKPEYHVDLAVYVKQPNGSLLLAKGREFSQAEQRKWVPAAPGELTQYVCERFNGEEQAQFRRCIRYLKRWRDENFNNGAPLSIALTVAAASWFEPRRADDGTYVDLEALHFLVKKMCSNFEIGWSVNRLVVRHPAPVRADLMSGLTDAQMVTFAERLKNLQQALENCFGDIPVTEAAPILAAQFGSDFPLANLALIEAESQSKRLTRV